MTDPRLDDLERFLRYEGPLPRSLALAALEHAGKLLGSADFVDAARVYQRVIGFDDPAVTAAAMVGLGEALHRLDDDAQALATWESATRLPESPSSYAAWRNVAAARVRAGDLRGAFAAYREAERRAPLEDRPEIASRLGWISRELGDRGAAGRYFARARGDEGSSFALGLVVLTALVSIVTDLGGPAGSQIRELLMLNKPAVAGGEPWRLVTVTLVHARLTEMPFHLVFNCYALWLVGPVVERLYGRLLLAVAYLLFAVGGSVATFAFGGAPLGVGASGAIFGCFGLLFAARSVHRPVLDREARAFVGQLGGLIGVNLLFGLLVPGIDNLAHVGGLLTGLAFGALVAPTRVATLRSLWLRPGPTPGTLVPAYGAAGNAAIRASGFAALVAVLALLWAIGRVGWG